MAEIRVNFETANLQTCQPSVSYFSVSCFLFCLPAFLSLLPVYCKSYSMSFSRIFSPMY